MMMTLRSSLAVFGTAVAIIAAAATAPAQQVPRPPGMPAPGPPSTGPQTPPPGPTIPPGPAPDTSPTTAPGAAPAPAATASGAPSAPALTPLPKASATIIRFTGQLLDLRNGFVYFTTSDAFKASPAIRIVDYDTGAPTTLVPGPRLYARATLDPASGAIVELALTKRKLASDAVAQQGYALAHAFVVAGSARVAAPELAGGPRITGRAVAVTFYVQIPPTTPLTDDVFITTDASGWVANAMKMDRIDALHYRLTRTYASGTKFAYRYTRGTWTSVEVGEDGLQDDPHQFFVPEVDAKRLTDVIYRWSDQNPSQPEVGPNSIPTPFNPNPFGNIPSAIQHPGIPPASPTPRP